MDVPVAEIKPIPEGAWIALSHDLSHVVSYDAELKRALQKAKDAGEDSPVMVGRKFFNGDPRLRLHEGGS
jgi:hypothetical protein